MADALISGLVQPRLLPRRICVAAGGALILAACGERQAEDAVRASLPAGSDVRFQQVEDRGDAVCGQVNVAASGSKQGYRRFTYDRVLERARIEPVGTYTPDDVAGFEATCRLVSQGGSTLDRSACELARQARARLTERTAFDAEWTTSCAASE